MSFLVETIDVGRRVVVVVVTIDLKVVVGLDGIVIPSSLFVTDTGGRYGGAVVDSFLVTNGFLVVVVVVVVVVGFTVVDFLQIALQLISHCEFSELSTNENFVLLPLKSSLIFLRSRKLSFFTIPPFFSLSAIISFKVAASI